MCHGLLHGCRCLLGCADWYEEAGPAVVAAGAPALLRVALLVARGQPQLIPGVGARDGTC